MKTSKRIMELAEYVLDGQGRGGQFQEFRAVAEANGYKGNRGGWITFGGEKSHRGWSAFAYDVWATKEVVLREPATIEEEAEDQHMKEIHEATGSTESASAHTADIVYFYTTRTQTVPLTDLTDLTVVIADEATPGSEGPCQSGAALNCTGTGVRRVLPESLLGDSIGEDMVQCVPCFEASAAAYARKTPHYTAPEA